VEEKEKVETEDLANDPEWGTLDEAAQIWDVTRGNIKYYVNCRGVPSKKAPGEIVFTKEDMIYVHLPSLRKVKDERKHDAGKGNL